MRQGAIALPPRQPCGGRRRRSVRSRRCDSPRASSQRQEQLGPGEATSQRAYQDARQQLAAAQNELAAAEVQRRLLDVPAPIDGTVMRINAKLGDAIDPSTVLAEMVDLTGSSSTPRCEAWTCGTGQARAARSTLSAGTRRRRAATRRDAARPAATAHGRVHRRRRSTARPIPCSSARAVPATSGLGPGSSSTCASLTDERRNQLAVPVESIVQGPDGPEVALVEGDTATRTPRHAGLRDGGLVEIAGRRRARGHVGRRAGRLRPARRRARSRSSVAEGDRERTTRPRTRRAMTRSEGCATGSRTTRCRWRSSASALCVGGVYSAYRLPSSVFPRTDFPRVVILVDNGVMPADEMMATITRPIEEAMKDIPGVDERQVGDRARLGRDQRVLQLVGRHGAVRAVRRRPAVADPQHAAGDGHDVGLPADVLGLSDHRHQPDQPDARPHVALGDGALQR